MLSASSSGRAISTATCSKAAAMMRARNSATSKRPSTTRWRGRTSAQSSARTCRASSEMEKQLEILDQQSVVRELVGECELTGKRTLFLRGGRPVAILASYDEYLALRETIDIVND